MKQRIISALIAILICVPVVLVGGNLFYIGVALLGMIGFYELMKVRKEKRDIPGIIKSLLMVMFILLMMNDWGDTILINSDSKFALTILLVLIPTIFYNKSGKYNIEDALFYLGAILLLSTGFNTLANIRINNLYVFIYLIMITIFTDTFAYFTGYFIGKNKMCPSVSPNKTWEGFVGGLIMGTFISTVFYVTALDFEGSILTLTLVTLVLSVIGQLGDLLFSVIKRHYEVKDYGNIMPGHGGVLDRLDSILTVVIAFLMLSRFL